MMHSPQWLPRLAKAQSPSLLAQDVARAAASVPGTTALVFANTASDQDLALLSIAGVDLPRPLPAQIGRPLSLSGWVLQTGEPLHCPDLARDPRSLLAVQLGWSGGSVLSVPVTTRGQTAWALTLYSPHSGDHLLEQLPELQALAAAAGLALELLTLRQIAHAQVGQLAALQELSRLLAETAATVGALVERLTPAPEDAAPAPAPRPRLDLSGLTEREREILDWVAEGYTNREIAAALFLSEATVKTHVSRILQKLNLPDRTKAAVYLMRGQPLHELP